ncbi:MAG: FecCD family ABC transporter permease [Bacteroidia bacterium]
MRTKSVVIYIIVIVLLFLADLYLAGSTRLDLTAFFNGDFILSQIRLPKALTAVICGISLPVAGHIMQVVFRNPLAGPYVLGITSGSAFFVGLSIMLSSSAGIGAFVLGFKITKVLASVLGSVVCTLFILFLTKKWTSNAFILIVGLLLGQLFGSLVSFLEYFSADKSLKAFVLWSFGTIGTTDYIDLLIMSIISLMSVSFVMIKRNMLLALLLGETYSSSIGIDFQKARFSFILISSILVALCTAFCGPIAFIGLSVPIMARMIHKTANQSQIISACIFIGICVMLLGDIISQNVLTGQILPINLITTLIGSPFVIYLLLSKGIKY